MINFKGKKVLVYGLGESGQAVSKLLHGKGAVVSIYDDENRFCSFFNFDNAPLSHQYDAVVLSPGVKILGNNIVSHFVISKTPIYSELDVAYNFCKGTIIGITGTNGKTTVTSLVGKIFKAAGKQTYVCGNIGLPFSSVCEAGQKDSVYVVEVSNFQLESSQKFCCDTACILNLEPDHLDRHASFEEYVRVKRKIISQKRRQKIVLNFDEPYSKTSKISKKVLYFSKFPLKYGVYVKNNWIFYNRTKIMPVQNIPLLGEKNLENVLASVAIAVKNKIKTKPLREAIQSFKPPAHRLEYLGKYNGALVYDDSKATNLPSVEAALRALSSSAVYILMGGKNKDLNFDEFFAKGYKLLEVVAFGQAGEQIFESALNFGYAASKFDKLQQACDYVKRVATEKTIILLSPGCSSFDEFSSYAARGARFKEYIFEN